MIQKENRYPQKGCRCGIIKMQNDLNIFNLNKNG